MTAALNAKNSPTAIEAFLGSAEHTVGVANVMIDAATRELFSVDFSERLLGTAAAIVRPGSTAEVAELLRTARTHGVALVPRGGGMSYTLGAAPFDGAVIVDMTRMNRVVQLDVANRHVTVETGITWAELNAALFSTGLRPRFFGTMSGLRATVGGGLGNNATGHGQGDINDDLLGLQVVLPDGRVLDTGARATSIDAPVVRNYGPDFTGLFVHDAGALGIKTQATFRLHPRPARFAVAAWGFGDEGTLVDAICAVGRLGVATDVMGFGTYHHKVFANQPKPPPEEAKKFAKAVMAGAGGGLPGLARLAQIARPGALQALLKHTHSLTVITDGATQGIADASLDLVLDALRPFGGKSLPPALGIGIRTQLFPPIDQLITGIDGECCFPSNCTVPLGKAREAIGAIDAFFRENEALMQKHGVFATRIFLTVKDLFGVEPIIYWRDAMNPLRADVLAPHRREALLKVPSNPQARAVALDLRRRLVDVIERVGGAHYQIGKFYPYREALQNAEAWQMLSTLKNQLDPDHLLNPGALGLVKPGDHR
jgi:FAD/FMN-containing dehydrogenase